MKSDSSLRHESLLTKHMENASVFHVTVIEMLILENVCVLGFVANNGCLVFKENPPPSTMVNNSSILCSSHIVWRLYCVY